MGLGQVFLLLVFVAMIALAVKIWRRFGPAESASASSEYSRKTDGSYEAFTVRPARAPKYKGFLYVGIFVLLFGLWGSLQTMADNDSSDFIMGLVIAAVGAGLFWLGWTIDYRPRSHRTGRTFRVSPTAVVVDGREFQRGDIHRLMIKNGVTDQMLQAWGSTTVVTEMSDANIANMVQRSRNAQVCYSLDLETGGKAFMLAGGMDETTVNGLLHDVCRVLQFSKS